MRVSEHYKLGLSQPSFEFLDVDIKNDTQVFVDPHAFRSIDSPWARECVSLIQDFFEEVLHCIRTNDQVRGHRLLDGLHESNEVHLGLSESQSQGGGISKTLANALWLSLSSSRAVKTGLISDLEDTSLFVYGIGHDRISDATINIVRSQLIGFTQDACHLYDIPMLQRVDSGPMWDRHLKEWKHIETELPIPDFDGMKLILVPKSVVRRTGAFDPGDYLRNFVFPLLRHQNLLALSPLVQYRKNGTPYVTNKSIIKDDPKSPKHRNLDVTIENRELLENYRAKKSRAKPLGHEEIADLTNTLLPDWDQLLQAVRIIPSGQKDADTYHRAVQALLTALFYPALDMPNREVKIHEGRKRIDITYVNVASTGFFSWVVSNQKVPAGQVIVEAKNYTGPLENPEFDQLTGRFSPLRGQFGILCYRGFSDNKDKVIQHCRDAALDHRGFVLALDDNDLAELVTARKNGSGTMFQHLINRFNKLIS